MQLISPIALLCHIKWYSSITKITTSTADQSLQNWIWRETLCVWACCWCRQEWNLWQQRLVAPGWHLFPAAPTTAPKVLLHLSRVVADKCSAEVLPQFPHNQCLRRSGDVDFQAPFTSWWPSQGVLPEKPPGAEQMGTASQQGLSSQNPTPSRQKRS